MRAKQFVTELFKNQTVPWRWDFRGSEEVSALFNVGEVPYRFHAYEENHKSWEVEFMVDGLPNDKAYALTGSGSAATVMSTVVGIMKDFLVRYEGKINKLTFSAMEESRQDLYARMIHRLLPTWQLTSNAPEFVLTSPEYAEAKRRERDHLRAANARLAASRVTEAETYQPPSLEVGRRRR
jgi:hypothetical protein